MARNFVKASSQYASIASAVVGFEPFSVACWFWQASAQNQEGTIFSLGEAGTSNYHSLETSTGLQVRARTRNSSGALSATSLTFSEDTWVHGAGVWAGSNDRRAFRNGGGKGTDTSNRVITGFNETRIGLQTSGAARHWDGYLAEMGVWDTALTDAEVALLALGASPLQVRPSSLVAYWPFLGRYSPEIDVVGGYNLTLHNGPGSADHPRIYYPAAPQIVVAPQLSAVPIGSIASYYAQRRAS